MPDTAGVTDIIFDRSLSLSEKAYRDGVIASNEAFIAAMNRAIKKRRESAVPGTFVDLTPPISAIRLRGTVPMSACGSPAQMCMEHGSDHGGTETMK